MPYPIENKLVIAIASSALFDLSESDEVYRKQGGEAYRAYQEQHIDDTLQKGVAFPFVKRLLSLNNSFPDEQPVEVVLFSKNSPETGLRIFRSIAHYGLKIERAVFSSGKESFSYLPAFNASIFLSANEEDVRKAVAAGYAAGTVLKSPVVDDDNDVQLRLGFDFDGVVADDEAERCFQAHNDLNEFRDHEVRLANSPLAGGPIEKFLKHLSVFQRLERKKKKADPTYQRILNTAIITARSAPAHERVVITLKSLGIEVDQVFFLGGICKQNILNVFKPHIFFDDQMVHLKNLGSPAVHIPFGKINEIHNNENKQ